MTSRKGTAQGISSRGRGRGVGDRLVLLAALSSAACGGADEAPAGEAASLQAVLSIERIEDAARAETPRASAMAQFLVLPSDADAHETLDAAGLRVRLPEQKGCLEAVIGDAPESSSVSDNAAVTYPDDGFPEQLELLEAGDVSINVDGVITRLALNLFPPSGNASGVIYTTPDQSAAPLPPATAYAISATGSDAIPPLTIQHEAPNALRDVTIGGTPLEHASAFSGGQPLDFTWTEGEPSDRVYVELADADTSLWCAFADADGSGTIPGALTGKLDPSSVARVSVHRVREVTRAQAQQRADAMVLETMVRFDFELTSVLSVD